MPTRHRTAIAHAATWLALGLVAAAAPAAQAADLPAPVANAGLPAPVAAGESAANIALRASSRWVLVRWVAREPGTLTALHLRIQADGASCRRTGRVGYGAGNGGSWLVSTHLVLPDGRPDFSRTLAMQQLRPCRGPLSAVDVSAGVVRLAMGLTVVRGHEYATVIRNTDRAPGRNYTSPNFLFTSTGVLGANGRNQRSAAATDAYYGLDPRELVGYSKDGGRTWALPGGPYGAHGGRSFLPTYVQQYADGRVGGQPYYYAAAANLTPRTMVFANITRPWTIRALGAFSRRAARGTLTLTVDGSVRARTPVSGAGMLRASILPTSVAPGQTVKVTATGLPIQNVVADTAWGRLLGMNDSTALWRLQGEPNFTHAAPVYALPACGVSCTDVYGTVFGLPPAPR